MNISGKSLGLRARRSDCFGALLIYATACVIGSFIPTFPTHNIFYDALPSNYPIRWTSLALICLFGGFYVVGFGLEKTRRASAVKFVASLMLGAMSLAVVVHCCFLAQDVARLQNTFVRSSLFELLGYICLGIVISGSWLLGILTALVDLAAHASVARCHQ